MQYINFNVYNAPRFVINKKHNSLFIYIVTNFMFCFLNFIIQVYDYIEFFKT